MLHLETADPVLGMSSDGASITRTMSLGEDASETRVLIVVTGGTICMQPSERGLVPV